MLCPSLCRADIEGKGSSLCAEPIWADFWLAALP